MNNQFDQSYNEATFYPRMADVKLMPTKGLTLRKGNRVSNVHCVEDGLVYYSVYIDGDVLPVALYKVPIEKWQEMLAMSIKNGAQISIDAA